MQKYENIWKMIITSPDFKNNDFLWMEFSCDWNNLIPRIMISDIPENAKSIAIIIDYPDAPKATWIHYLAWDIKTNWNNTLTLFENNIDIIPWSKKWLNSFENLNWWSPCPPKWHWVHRYYFKVYALNKETLNLNEWANKEELLDVMQWHNISFWEIIWLFKRD